MEVRVMKKKTKNILQVIMGVMAIIAIIGAYLIGFDSGYKTISKDLVKSYEQGLKDASGAISSMYSYYPDELNSPEGNVVTKVIIYDDLKIVRILWVKNRNGRLDYGLATTYDKLPTK